ncbi:hypothetical protein [Flexivirga meconopsidis]|uniref:hypothetical protein n=1 Tax=Flexivirga meconopsidis TaxID=2977121 RepID=UPI00223FE2CA|nr:hypothetical protein [Flexivirga meconopsidis]
MSEQVEASITAAMNRLLDGKPDRTDGALTKENIRREAGISRATLFRAPQLLEWWDEQVGARAGRTPAEFARETENNQLKAEMAELKRKLRETEKALTGAKGIIGAMQVELDQLRSTVNNAAGSKVTPLRRR